MIKMGAEKIWAYLNDDEAVVGINSYFGNRYMYLSKLLEILYVADPIALSEVKQRMYNEKASELFFFGNEFEQLREGYGQTEYRIVKLSRIKNVGKNLEKYFPELLVPIKKEDSLIDMIEIPLVDLKRLEADEEYRFSIARAFEEDEEICEELTKLVNSGNMVVVNLLLNGPELPHDKPSSKIVKK